MRGYANIFGMPFGITSPWRHGRFVEFEGRDCHGPDRHFGRHGHFWQNFDHCSSEFLRHGPPRHHSPERRHHGECRNRGPPGCPPKDRGCSRRFGHPSGPPHTYHGPPGPPPMDAPYHGPPGLPCVELGSRPCHGPPGSTPCPPPAACNCHGPPPPPMNAPYDRPPGPPGPPPNHDSCECSHGPHRRRSFSPPHNPERGHRRPGPPCCRPRRHSPGRRPSCGPDSSPERRCSMRRRHCFRKSPERQHDHRGRRRCQWNNDPCCAENRPQNTEGSADEGENGNAGNAVLVQTVVVDTDPRCNTV